MRNRVVCIVTLCLSLAACASNEAAPRDVIPPRVAPAALAADVSPAPQSASRSSGGGLRRDVETLARAVSRIEARLAGLEAAPAGHRPVDEEAEEGVPGPGDEAEALHRAARLLARGMAREVEDPGWSDRAYGEIVATFDRQSVPGMQLADVQCGTTVCQVAVAFDDPATFEQGVDRVAELVPWDGAATIHPDPADPLVVVLYAAREGHDAPTP